MQLKLSAYLIRLILKTPDNNKNNDSGYGRTYERQLNEHLFRWALDNY